MYYLTAHFIGETSDLGQTSHALSELPRRLDFAGPLRLELEHSEQAFVVFMAKLKTNNCFDG